MKVRVYVYALFPATYDTKTKQIDVVGISNYLWWLIAFVNRVIGFFAVVQGLDNYFVIYIPKKYRQQIKDEE